MYEAYTNKTCVFDDPLPENNVVLYSNATHRMWHNPYPLKHTSLHLIIAPIRHILGTDPTAFTLDYRRREAEVIVWAYDTFPDLQKKGGGEVKRFGLLEHSCGTVEHDHRNLIVTDLSGDVRMTIAKKPKETEAAIKRVGIYRELYAGKTKEDLTPEQLELVHDRI